jgi:hypothetical protein
MSETYRMLGEQRELEVTASALEIDEIARVRLWPHIVVPRRID